VRLSYAYFPTHGAALTSDSEAEAPIAQRRFDHAKVKAWLIRRI
jgi:hypothetical protein